MKHGKQLERRTFNQDRFEILIKRQKNGTATFNELSELDEIVNRDPDIREIVLEEMQDADTPKPPDNEQIQTIEKPIRKSFIEKIKAFISRLFTAEGVSMSPSIAA
jgi:phage repressor protein C with HTH and peptisase S24 domain